MKQPEQFYFPDAPREHIQSIEKSDEDYFKPKYTSHSPFLNVIEKAFEDEEVQSKRIKRRPKKVSSKSNKTAVEAI